MNTQSLPRLTIIAVLLLAFFLAGGRASAQVIILDSEDAYANISYEVKAQIQDSVTNEPVSFASFYIKPVKDTIITGFALTDTTGHATIKSITRGEYYVNVEFMGYLPYSKKMYIRKDLDLGTIRLKPDLHAIEAAKVSAVAEPVEFRRDTIIYNAAAFGNLAGDKLIDLLRKMPGIEVSDDGTVKVEGKEVSKITVGGKTFFLGDNSVALNNLPAEIVDKVKVIDKDSKEAQFTGIKEREKEKVMDIELKEEFKKGFFGNLTLGGGTAASTSKDEYIEKKDFLFNDDVMLAAYGDKDMLTVLGSAMNARTSKPIGMAVLYDGVNKRTLPYDGIHTSAQAGVNFNTDRIKKMETTATASYSMDDVDKKERTERTTFMTGSDDIRDESEKNTTGTSHGFKLNFNTESNDVNRGSFLIFRPSISYGRIHENDASSALSYDGDALANRSSGLSGADEHSVKTGFSLQGGKSNLFGKDRRSFSIHSETTFAWIDGTSFENTRLDYASEGRVETRFLNYDETSTQDNIRIGFRYVEPIAEKFSLMLEGDSSWGKKNTTKDASDAEGTFNAWYSSATTNKTLDNSIGMLGQYNDPSKKLNLQMGMGAYATYDETWSKAYNMETTTGKGEWTWSFMPRMQLSKGFGKMTNTSLILNSNQSIPSATLMVPSFNISNPTRLNVGNIYLKPEQHESIYLQGNTRTKKKLSFNVFSSLSFDSNSTVNATWFDDDNIRYTIPVNSKKPAYSVMFNGSSSVPLDKKGTLRLTLTANGSLARAVSYQTEGKLKGIDTDAFDYQEFMSDFWGDASGSRFYSGKSGFNESLTNSSSFGESLALNWRPGKFILNASENINWRIYTYSLDKAADSRLASFAGRLEGQYTTPHEFVLKTDVKHTRYWGTYAQYYKPVNEWNASVSRNIKAFMIALYLNDILDQANTRTRNASELYVQDTYVNKLGRTIILSLTWNFGKMNASQSQKAQSAKWQMSF